MANITTQVGQPGSQNTGQPNLNGVLRVGPLNSLIVSELDGRYYEDTLRGNRFYAATQGGVTGVAWTIGTTTALVGLCISNPVGNNKNIVLDKLSFSFPVIDTVVNSVYMGVNFSNTTNVTHTTALTPAPLLIGSGATPTAKADSSFTVPTTPIVIGNLVDMPGATTLPSGGILDLEGSVILSPGAYFVVSALAATPTNGIAIAAWWSEKLIAI